MITEIIFNSIISTPLTLSAAGSFLLFGITAVYMTISSMRNPNAKPNTTPKLIAWFVTFAAFGVILIAPIDKSKLMVEDSIACEINANSQACAACKLNVRFSAENLFDRIRGFIEAKQPTDDKTNLCRYCEQEFKKQANGTSGTVDSLCN